MIIKNTLLSTALCLTSLFIACDDNNSDEAQQDSNIVTVFEFMPAPGQYVNSGYTATTPKEATTYAENNLNANTLISLGGWGGYVVVGFDHSILNIEDSRDLWIGGNAYASSNEPAVVWVMQDINGDGLPNDIWYEVKGSEYDLSGTVQGYAVTYYRADAGESIPWTDNCGGSGTIDPNAFYTQSYFPAWISDDCYTLTGTKLASRTEDLSTGDSEYWINSPFEWGYVDNAGSDYLNSGTEIELDNAVNQDGTPANLEYIDFVKVQAAVNAKAGWLGEVSPEITGFKDLNL